MLLCAFHCHVNCYLLFLQTSSNKTDHDISYFSLAIKPQVNNSYLFPFHSSLRVVASQVPSRRNRISISSPHLVMLSARRSIFIFSRYFKFYNQFCVFYVYPSYHLTPEFIHLCCPLRHWSILSNRLV